MAKQLKITLVKSPIGFEQSQEDPVRGLGMRKLNETVLLNGTPQIRGMIYKGRHMLKVEEVES